jgi:hypothetical protein
MLLQFFQGRNGFDFRVTDKGHSFLTMLVAFLVVSRATVSLGRYNQVRAALENIYCMTRQLVHQMTVFSSDNVNQSGKEWRHEVAYLAMLELRAVMAVIDYQSDGVPAWDHPEFDKKTMTNLKKQLFLTNDNLKFSHHRNYSEFEENMRVPVRMSLRLREVVIGQRKKLDKPFAWPEEAQLLGTIDKLMTGYYGYVIDYFVFLVHHDCKLSMLTFPFFCAFHSEFALS